MSSKPPAPGYFGRYQVLEELGSGAMGIVYLCVDPRLTRPVAIKVLRESPHMTPPEQETFRARFRHEVEAAGRMNHPGIVQIYDLGPSYIVMEFLEGKPLSALLKAGATLSVRAICSLILRVADAIDYAHRQGIVHRDVKPANIMLTDDGGVKVLDFGVARLESSTLTAAGTVVGSVRYMAPEQMMGEAIDGRADVFSLGAVAFELLTAHPPFPGKTITEVVGQVVHGAYVPPRRLDPRLPQAVDAVFARAFAITPADRYPRAMELGGELYEALEGALDLEVVHGGSDPPPTTIERNAPLQETVGDRAPVATAAASPGGKPTRREGVLLMDTDPAGASVSVDGEPQGVMPLAPLELGFGRHVVRVEAAGCEPVTTEVELTREQPLKILGLSLPPARPEGVVLKPGQFVRFGPEVTPPRRLSGATPQYPAAARERAMEGAPIVEIWIDEGGNVTDVAIVESAGSLLDTAVLEVVAGWRFSPAMKEGVPVSVRLTLQHLFRH